MVNELPPFITEAEVKSRRFLAKDEPDYVTEAKVKKNRIPTVISIITLQKYIWLFIYTYTLYYSKIHYIYYMYSLQQRTL